MIQGTSDPRRTKGARYERRLKLTAAQVLSRLDHRVRSRLLRPILRAIIINWKSVGLRSRLGHFAAEVAEHSVGIISDNCTDNRVHVNRARNKQNTM